MIRAAASGRLLRKLKEYLLSCRPPPDADAKKKPCGFPNLAGFCRFLGCGVSSLDELRAAYPEQYELVCATLEDEALNFSPSPTVLTAYLKQRIWRAEPTPDKSAVSGGDQLRLIFEHDILEDGS
jgi:hypothetical protein